jgi:putative mRNA 3-end processing factor
MNLTLEDLKPQSIPYVSRQGTIVLSNNVVVDGYRPGFRCRVQSHVHDDHMKDFDRSKGSLILCTPATRDLLLAEFNADLPIRGNLVPVPPAEVVQVGDETVTLYTANHMLGSCQVVVESEDFGRVVYSGDFGWPVGEVAQADRLVLDSTYGSPRSKTLPDRSQMLENAVDFVRGELIRGVVCIYGFRGAISRFISDMLQSLDVPILCSDRRRLEMQVYGRYGYMVGNPISPSESEYEEIKKSGHYVQLIGKGDERPDDSDQGVTHVYLSALIAREANPIVQLADRTYQVLYSDHADFDHTLEYVQATGAEFVLTDSSRGKYASELATSIANELSIEASPSAPEPTDLY